MSLGFDGVRLVGLMQLGADRRARDADAAAAGWADRRQGHADNVGCRLRRLLHRLDVEWPAAVRRHPVDAVRGVNDRLHRLADRTGDRDTDLNKNKVDAWERPMLGNCSFWVVTLVTEVAQILATFTAEKVIIIIVQNNPNFDKLN
jgi:hypothetical protein